MKERNTLFNCTTHTFSRVCQIYCIKNETEFNNIISSFGVRADDGNTLLQYYDILFQDLDSTMYLFLSPPLPYAHIHTTHTHNTHTLFYNKIAQEQKSSKTAVCYSNHFSFYNLQLTGRSDIYKK